MIDYLQGYILLAYRNSIIYLNVSQYGIDDETDKHVRDEIVQQNWFSTEQKIEHQRNSFIEIDIAENQICYLDLLENYKIICI